MTEIDLPARGVVVLIGAAGSGKSTLAARLFGADEVLSSDRYRAVLTGDEADQRASGTAFRLLTGELERRLAAGRRAVVDATNLRPADRRPWLAAARRHGVPSLAIVLAPPSDDVRRQGRSRSRVVADEVVERQLRALASTLRAGGAGLRTEGFDVAILLRSAAEIAALRPVGGPGGQPAGSPGVEPLDGPADQPPDA